MIGFGLVGVGSWGVNYIETIKKISEVQLRWVYSPSKNALPVLLKDCKFTNNYENLLEDNEVKGIIISTPPATHYDLAKAALNANKDVLVEKPMTLYSKEALELHNLSLEKSKILMVGHIYIYHPGVQKLKEIIKQGELEDLFYFHSERCNLEQKRFDVNVLWDLAPHDFSIMNYLFEGSPVSINVQGNTVFNSGVENIMDVLFEYSKNFSGSVHNSWISPKKKREIILVGRNKYALFDDLSKKKLMLYDQNKHLSYYPPLSKKNPLEIECLHFLDCIMNKKQPLTGGYEGYVNVKLLEAAQQSLISGKKVFIEKF